MARWNTCNIFDPGPGSHSVWQFNAASKKFPLVKEESKPKDQTLNQALYEKDWSALFQPRLNVAWLPPEEVFLRAIQLPAGDEEELQSMIDIQLEKLSPLPPSQIVWTFLPLPQIIDDLQTVIVVMVSRQRVEAYLGSLEEAGFLADRLELPLLDQLAATEMSSDGVWVFPTLGSSDKSCLVAWQYGGTLQNLSLIPVPEDADITEIMQEHLTQVAWAGEIEGWLSGDVHIKLVATPQTAAKWENLFTEDQHVAIVQPIPLKDLASLTGKRALSDSKRINLLPQEFTARYKQKLVDKVWIRAVAASAVLYIFIAALYIGFAQFVGWQASGIRAEIDEISAQYTTTQKLKAEVKILQEQLALQYAALNCWKAITDNIPSELELDQISFSNGRVGIRGSGDQKIPEFETRLRSAVNLDGEVVFKEVELRGSSTGASGKSAWRIEAHTTAGGDQ